MPKNNISVDKIKEIIGVDKINENNLEYYYLDKNVLCCDIDIEPMFKGVKDFDYLGPIKELSKYYKDEYYYELLKRNQGKIEAPLYIKDYDYDLDEILLQYIKCVKDSSVLVVWPKGIKPLINIKNTNFYKELEKNGKIHGIKEINLTRKQVQGMIYQIYYDKDGFKSLDAIKGKQQKSDADNHKNKFFIIFYKANNFKEISGKDASLKVKLREILRDDSQDKTAKLNFFLHVTDNHTQVVELSQLYCNKNSMRLLQYQRLDRILFKDFYKSQVILMTFKQWLYKEIHPLDHVRFMLFSSIILYTLGLRDINDLDLMIHHLPKKSKTSKFDNKINHFFDDETTKFTFVDYSMKGKGGWVEGGEKEYLLNWFDKEWPSMYGSKSMSDTILNPKHHYYYLGIKLISTKADIKRRIQRNRAAAFADLIAMMEYLHIDIDFPKFPKGYWSAHKYYEFTSQAIKKLLKTTSFYLYKRYNIRKSPEEIEKIILV